MAIVPGDPDRHAAFVYDSWIRGCGEPRDVLRHHLNTGARIAVLEVAPDLFAGWAAVTRDQQIVWVYVKEAARGNGVMTALLVYLDIDTTKPITALYRSPASEGLIRKGWSIAYPECDIGREDDP